MSSYHVVDPTAEGKANGHVKQKRALRKLLRDLVVFTGTAIHDLESAPRKQAQRKCHQRLLYRCADTLSDDEVKRVVVEIGPERVLRALDMYTQPTLFEAAE